MSHLHKVSLKFILVQIEFNDNIDDSICDCFGFDGDDREKNDSDDFWMVLKAMIYVFMGRLIVLLPQIGCLKYLKKSLH